MSAKVRVSPVSKTAAILIILVGVFTFVTGIAGGVDYNTVAGAAFIVLGLVLYRLLFRFTRKVERELNEAGPGSAPSTPD
jgi:divalent metal cation (Fe/Co/Zn/Cd) transporter